MHSAGYALCVWCTQHQYISGEDKIMGNYYRRSGGRRSGGGSRWMELHYAGTCKVCRQPIAKGELAFWDSGAKTVTHHKIDCADADGLTTVSPLTGPWDKRTDTRVFTDHRIGAAAPGIITTTFNSGATVYQNARGRCEDAPCCGCCS